MQIAVNKFVEEITNENYEIKQVEATKSEFAKKKSKLVDQMITNFVQVTNDDKLVQSRLLLKTKGEPIIISLESGVINLPFENVKQVDNFFDQQEDEVPAVVNLIVKAPAINASGLRIDQICSVTELGQAPEEFGEKITARVQELLDTIEENSASKK
ncbi:hypothetical protein [Ligilactobacillus acidipiscis]|uniref:Uncharacterized protein n=2 Tax=Ligilactobacillus acidipiscis TaxID=89059 RepID=A0A921F688_9LACO|nr:hypothetical protein [Ligilactobacillus acidipiscis]GAW63134.1 hypothetical protein Lacidipiscis_00316 [Ligilactobacillus acidipiscis]GEN20139.1 hypothetical protein LAC02_34200 [Ligilactobacillus acidipiscis]HJE96091.1 hypothetical protein [Ligilactobacillus acidipiscis]